MAKFFYIIPLILVSLACGVSASAENALGVNKSILINTEESTPLAYVEMVVTGDLYIRTLPGEKQPLVDGKNVLHAGDVVTCYTMYTGVDVGDGWWCLHELGWSNVRWLEVR